MPNQYVFSTKNLSDIEAVPVTLEDITRNTTHMYDYNNDEQLDIDDLIALIDKVLIGETSPITTTIQLEPKLYIRGSGSVENDQPVINAKGFIVIDTET